MKKIIFLALLLLPPVAMSAVVMPFSDVRLSTETLAQDIHDASGLWFVRNSTFSPPADGYKLHSPSSGELILVAYENISQAIQDLITSVVNAHRQQK